MRRIFTFGLATMAAFFACSPHSQRGVAEQRVLGTPASSAFDGGRPPTTPEPETPLASLPYSPSLDVSSMDWTVDPCVDLYEFACGSWKKNNPVPPDQAKWGVYGKLSNQVRRHLWGLLIEAAKASNDRTPSDKQLGDYFASCMDEAAIDEIGPSPLRPALDSLAAARDLAALTRWLAQGSLSGGGSLLFRASSEQDASDATRFIAGVHPPGLGLPDRDDYLASDEKSVQLRARYHAYVEKLLGLLGDDATIAAATADLVLRFETELAKASLTRVERRDPQKTFHRMPLAELETLAPAIRWRAYLRDVGFPEVDILDVSQPKFMERTSVLLQEEPLESWKRYLRWQLVRRAAHVLGRPFVEEEFAFYGKYVRGKTSLSPRWKRCIDYVDGDLGEALGELFVKRNFSTELRARAQALVLAVQAAMEKELGELGWMSPATKKEAFAKLRSMANKIGYPDKFRDYSAIIIDRRDFFGNVVRSWRFEEKRRIARIGKPIDRNEWHETPQTVDAYYNDRMNDINFTAAVLLPPLFDPRMDDAPNYGNTGGTVGHELIHAFDDSGRKFDAKGNLRNWWSTSDAKEFEARAKCISDQYSGYIAVDDVHVNGKLTLGEDLADLGGLILAHRAWTKVQAANLTAKEAPKRDDLTPSQRFFVGYAQWACANVRPEAARLSARTDEHSPPRYRINGVVMNMPEYAEAFSCKEGQPMAKPKGQICKVW